MMQNNYKINFQIQITRAVVLCDICLKMVESCSAVNCCNRRRKDVKMKFERIPTDPNMRKLWLHAIRRENFTPSTTTVICKKHFTSGDYEVSVHGNKALKKVAVPSVFDFPAHLEKEPIAIEGF
ncbi:unnamed protein product [Acanthoscelides obtectus]|uniref:THAP-type domain-containing protein n=1 Tax=Acanthoscelides obtectus TaxID=200917 RepID=A0A9P0LK31_ACAOB|nr:unnamed protein product [Acanthoscelides obtectus]CAK1624367.1 THAP domain-containing protein 2 [Acanthoscelides obtectus]